MSDTYIAAAKKVSVGTDEVVASARKIHGCILMPDGTNPCNVVIYRGTKATAGQELFPLRAIATESKSDFNNAPIDVDPPPVVGIMAGTVAITAGSTTLTGTGTAFLANIAKGARITIGKFDYIVASVSSDTAAVLAENAKETLSGVAYIAKQDGFRVVVTGTGAYAIVYWS